MEDDKLMPRVMMKQKEQPGNHWYQGVEEIDATLDLLKEMTRNQWRRRVVETKHRWKPGSEQVKSAEK